MRDGDDAADQLASYYPDLLPEALRIKGLVCFFNENVDIELDGELQERPDSPWSHGANRAANLPPAQTRGWPPVSSGRRIKRPERASNPWP